MILKFFEIPLYIYIYIIYMNIVRIWNFHAGHLHFSKVLIYSIVYANIIYYDMSLLSANLLYYIYVTPGSEIVVYLFSVLLLSIVFACNGYTCIWLDTW